MPTRYYLAGKSDRNSFAIVRKSEKRVIIGGQHGQDLNNSLPMSHTIVDQVLIEFGCDLKQVFSIKNFSLLVRMTKDNYFLVCFFKTKLRERPELFYLYGHLLVWSGLR